MPTDELARRLEPELIEQGLWSDAFKGARREWFLALINLYKGRLKKLPQFGDEARPLLTDQVIYDDEAVKKHLSKPELHGPMAELADCFDRLEPFTANALEERLRALATERQLKAASLIHATRVAVTGRAASPGLFEVLELAGRERVVHRIRAAEPFLLPTHPSESLNG